MSDALANLFAALPLLRGVGNVALIHPRGVPMRLPTPLDDRTTAVLLTAMGEGWRIEIPPPCEPMPQSVLVPPMTALHRPSSTSRRRKR